MRRTLSGCETRTAVPLSVQGGVQHRSKQRMGDRTRTLRGWVGVEDVHVAGVQNGDFRACTLLVNADVATRQHRAQLRACWPKSLGNLRDADLHERYLSLFDLGVTQVLPLLLFGVR